MTAHAHMTTATNTPVEYVGLKDSTGWRFVLIPMTAGEAHEDGRAADAPGYLLRTLTHADASVDAIKRSIEANPKARWFVESMEKRLVSPPDEWREVAWLETWLKAGLIRKATP